MIALTTTSIAWLLFTVILVGWLVYALLIHARLTFKISHRLFSMLTIGAAATVVFALWGVHYVYKTIHTYG